MNRAPTVLVVHIWIYSIYNYLWMALPWCKYWIMVRVHTLYCVIFSMHCEYTNNHLQHAIFRECGEPIKVRLNHVIVESQSMVSPSRDRLEPFSALRLIPLSLVNAAQRILCAVWDIISQNNLQHFHLLPSSSSRKVNLLHVFVCFVCLYFWILFIWFSIQIIDDII